MFRRTRKYKFLFLYIFVVFCCCGCVDYSKDRQKSTKAEENKSTPVIVATSMATVEICEKLGIPLAGVPESSLSTLPECYEDAVKIGSPMSPDMELIASLHPDWILSPVSLISDLKPKYEAQGYNYAFLNLSSIQGMYKSIKELGQLFQCESQAEEVINEFKNYYEEYQGEIKEEEAPTVLILMGLPGSYVAATPESYVGSLVALAGGKNIYSQEDSDFINVNAEDMLKKNPDIILRTSHALPDQVMEMFAEEFRTNDVWKHFEAVKNNQVYDLSNEDFGMSANFNYQKALSQLHKILTGKVSGADGRKDES